MPRFLCSVFLSLFFFYLRPSVFIVIVLCPVINVPKITDYGLLPYNKLRIGTIYLPDCYVSVIHFGCIETVTKFVLIFCIAFPSTIKGPV